MRPNTRKRVILTFLGLVVSGWLIVTRFGPQWEARELHVVAQAFVEAAAKGDYAGLVLSSASVQPVTWGLFIHRRIPELPRVAAAGMRADRAHIRSDTADVAYALPATVNDRDCGAFDHLYLSFIRARQGWRVASAALDCF